MRVRGFEYYEGYEGVVPLPQRATDKSAGYDFEAAETVTLAPGEIALIKTGLKAYMQSDEYLAVHVRSGLSVRNGLSCINDVGVIDADYYDANGHIMVPVINLGKAELTIEKGMRFAQGIFQKYLTIDNDTPKATARTGGFGSTGEKS